MKIVTKISLTILASVFLCLNASSKVQGTIRDSIKYYANHKPAKAIELFHRNRWAIDMWADSLKADCFVEMGKSYFFLPNADSARHYLNRAMVIYVSINDTYNIALVNRFLGNVEFSAGNYHKSLERYNNTIQASQALADTVMLITNLYNSTLPLRKLGRYEEAISYLSRAELLSIVYKWHKDLGNIYNQKGVIYRDWKRDTDASEYFAKAIETYEKDGNRYGKAAALVNQGNCLRSQKNFEAALKNHKLALGIYDSLGMKRNICKVNTNIGLVYLEKGDFQNALVYFDNGFFLATEAKDAYNAFLNLQNKGLAYYRMGVYEKSEDNFRKALQLGENGDFKSELLELYLELAQLYVATGRRIEANQFIDLYKTQKDVFINETIEDKISHYQVQFKTLEKENEIQKLSLERAQQDLVIQSERRKKMVTLVIALMLLLAGVASTALYRNRQRRRSAELSMKKAEIENRLLRVQMNPHFMFNSLNSVQSYIASNQNERAEDFLSRFAMLTRMILNQSRVDFVSLSEEIATIKTYLELEQQRFNDVFTFSISVDEQIDEDYIRVPPMLVQPFVENAILHGVAPLKKGGVIQVRYGKHTEHTILCTVEDNGIGREASSRINRGGKHRSLGLQVTQDRLILIQQQTGIALTLKTLDLRDDQGISRGTRVEMIIPYKEPENSLD